MKDKSVDVLLALGISATCLLLVVVGGLFHPNTLAGAVARFVWNVK